MVNQITIELKNLRFFGYHGIYENEKKIGNEFEVNLKVILKPDVKVITDLDQSINYVKLFELIRTKMKKTTGLLETWAMQTAEDIHDQFNMVKEIELSIKKSHPPIENFSGSVAVSYRKQY